MIGLFAGRVLVSHRLLVAVSLAVVIATLAAGCQASTAAPTAADAKQFLDEVNTSFTRLALDGSRAGWVAQNFITVDTEAMDARATQAFSDAASRFAKQAVRFDSIDVPADQRRQLESAEGLARAGDTVRSEGVGGADQPRVVDAQRVRQGQVVSGCGEDPMRARTSTTSPS